MRGEVYRAAFTEISGVKKPTSIIAFPIIQRLTGLEREQRVSTTPNSEQSSSVLTEAAILACSAFG